MSQHPNLCFVTTMMDKGLVQLLGKMSRPSNVLLFHLKLCLFQLIDLLADHLHLLKLSGY